jgi:plasmid segregation protein ParM
MTEENNKPEVNLSDLVGIDDGSAYEKLSYFTKVEGKLKIVTTLHKTSIADGMPNLTLNSSETDYSVLNVNGDVFTCDPAAEGYDIRTKNNHQTSNGLVALTHHALCEDGFGGKKVVIATGVPVKQYFGGENGDADKELLNAKKEAFTKATILNSMDEKGQPTQVNKSQLVTFRSNLVLPEAIGAFYDMSYADDGTRLHNYPEGVLVVDWGSNTVDVALIKADKIKREYVFTYDNAGFLCIYDTLRRELLSNGIKYNNIPNSRLEEALETGFLRVAGSKVDISEYCEKVISNQVNKIVADIRVQLKSELDFLECVLIVGAGSKYVMQGFKELAAICKSPSDPQGSNSKGFLKLLTYGTDSFDLIDDIK